MPLHYRPIDPHEAIDVVEYTRMSGDQQNKRSPQQQADMIRETLRRTAYPWTIIKSYCDEAKTGRMLRNRPNFNLMLNELKTRLVPARFVLVDTIERFARIDELEALRRDLYQRHNIVVLCADRNFDDPYSPQGRAATVFESYRASEDSRIKRHNVIRGKRDVIALGYWPGSPVPFGFELELADTETRGGREVRHHRLVHHPVNSEIVRSLFVKSIENPSMGQEALAKWLDSRPDIPSDLKPFIPATVGRWCVNSIYYGELVWAEFTTGIMDDMRVLERNPDNEVLRIPDFCEPIISKRQFEEVAALRAARRTNGSDSGQCNQQGRGLVYKYPLSNLVRCAHCNSSMVANGSGFYTTVSGEKRRYTAYACPKARADQCPNRVRVKEAWLRDVVIGKLRERLLPCVAGSEPPWLNEVVSLVEAELSRQHQEAHISRPALEAEMSRLTSQTDGWSISLAKPDLPHRVREKTENDYAEALRRIDEIQTLLHRQDTESRLAAEIVDPKAVMAGIASLSDVLASDCPTTTNLMLSMHIESIKVFESGQIVMRMCKLGTCPETLQWFGGKPAEEQTSSDTPTVGRLTETRRRTRVCTDLLEDDTPQLRQIAELATDPDRFSGMPNDWFWTDEFTIPEKSCWSKDNAGAVLARYQQMQQETGRKPSCNAIAKEFGVSRPTILTALDFAHKTADTPRVNHRRGSPVRVKDNPEVEARIEELHDAGVPEKDIAAEIGVARSTITAALHRLYAKRGIPKPDGRRERYRR